MGGQSDAAGHDDGAAETWKVHDPTFRRQVAILRSRPGILIPPLLVLLFTVATGSIVIYFTAKKYSDRRHDEALAAANSAISALAEDTRLAFVPAYSLAFIVQAYPSFPQLVASFATLASNVRETSRRSLNNVEDRDIYVLAPQGVVTFTDPVGEDLEGIDLLSNPAWRAVSLSALAEDTVSISGPSFVRVNGMRRMIVQYPIYVRNAEPDDYFGTDLRPSVCRSGEEDENLCYRDDTRAQFWGFSMLYLSFDDLIARSRLSSLTAIGYSYHLTRGVGDDLEVLTTGEDTSRLRDPVTVLAGVDRSDPWSLSVEPSSHQWTPSWLKFMYAVPVLVGATLGALLLMVLLSWRKHSILLNKMLPKETIKQLQRGESVMDRFDNVTVLYCDIVAFTHLSSQITSRELATFLNNIYTGFDVITDKHGLYKLDTIGDAFLLVGGCPQREDPHRTIKQVVACAQDMIRLTKDLMSPTGSKLETRIGIHSGPAITGVLGKKVPKFTLYGDTINVAARMESTGKPSSIHLSHASVKLLLESELPCQICQRTVVSVKGKGDMLTYYLAEPTAPDNTPEEVQAILGDCTIAAAQQNAEGAEPMKDRSSVRLDSL